MEQERKRLMEELRRLAYGEASDASGAALKGATKLKAIEMLGKVCGLFDQAGKGEEAVTVVEDVG